MHDAITRARCTDRRGGEISQAEAYESAIALAEATTANGNKLMFIGNGGSAGIASHMAIDFSKNGNMPALAFNDGAALTCLANDFGYDEVFARQMHFHARRGDLLVAISSSGRSPSILRAVDAALEIGCRVITFSGFDPANPLRSMGDVNFHVARHDYGLVEVAHTALVHAIVDLKATGSFLAAAQSLVAEPLPAGTFATPQSADAEPALRKSGKSSS
ncbi:MAG TPA: SIS domain-containing protein [Acidisarcina sp.]